MLYEFAAERQLIFPVSVNGMQRIVRFSEGNMSGASMFQTTDKKIAEAIRKMGLFKRGAIKDVTKEEPQTVAMMTAKVTKPARAWKNDAGAAEAKKAPKAAEAMAHITEEAFFPDTETEGEKAMTARGKALKAAKAEKKAVEAIKKEQEEVKTFSDFTHAREWFCKTYSVAKRAVRTPTALHRLAGEKKLRIEIEPE